MSELLSSLGVRPSSSRALGLIAIVVGVTASALVVASAVTALLGVPPVLVQAGAWVLWLGWLGLVFPRHRVLVGDGVARKPYREAFVRDLLPGVACNFALLLRPAVHGLVDASSHVAAVAWQALVGVGVALVVGGAALIISGVRVIGVARTFFVYEYRQHAGPVVSGIYSVIRHPLFVGGELGSLGLALCVGTPDALALAAVNVAVLPAYVLLEDRRCSQVMGEAYRRYRLVTGAVVPRAPRP